VKTPDELLAENRRLRRRVMEMEMRCDKLESYISGLSLRILESCPELLEESSVV
jgi:hypothetical protein